MLDEGCSFCNIVKQDACQRSEQDTSIMATERFEWIPGLGAFVEGYSLIISNVHVLNTGCLSVDAVQELEGVIADVKQSLRTLYGTGGVVFEHGTMGGLDQAGCCVEHHHIHVLPIDCAELPSIVRKAFPNLRSIRALAELKALQDRKIPYVYYETSCEKRYVFEAPLLPRQYMRQVLAAECGFPLDWDWQSKPFLPRIEAFVSKILRLGHPSSATGSRSK